MTSLVYLFVSEGNRLADTDLDTAIACLQNALCVRNLRNHNRLEILDILHDMRLAKLKREG